ncbi:putative ankyrin repeat protein RF_0381 isoform X2 [Hydra vulgaris]|uniref:putative ankyrin repeat protein RF_0381 isoform X2 n=1 Tax=Hydra vulgaris TaxID=6087 RepID=UPI001F5F8589|nr:putative ankyrin repeat protein RF_0381 isoform X2 [Hydra vulgaris]
MFFKKLKKKTYSCNNRSPNEKLVDLLNASRDGRTDIVKILKENGVDLNDIPLDQKNGQGLSALHIAARYNQPDCVIVLLENGADANKKDNFGFQACHDASLKGHYECLYNILKYQKFPVSVKDLDYITPMFYAIQNNHTECLNLLTEYMTISSNAVVEIYSKRNVDSRVLQMVDPQKIVDARIDGSRNFWWWWWGSMLKYFVSQLRLFKNLPIDKISEYLNNCAMNGDPKAFYWFKMNIKNISQEQINQSMLVAVQHGWINYVESLLNEGSDVNTRSKDQSTALHYAAKYDHVELIEKLCIRGAQINAKNNEKWTPLHIAILQDNTDSVKQLLKCSCNVNEQGGPEEDTPLHMVLKLDKDEEIFKEILKWKPDITIRNKNSLLPIQIKTERESLKKMLKDYSRNM